MRAVILADRSMAVRERVMLARLELGLVGEGVRVVHAIPAECIDAEPIGLYSTPIAYEHGWSWTRESRVRRLAERLRKAFDIDDREPVDIVHVFAAEGPKGEVGETWEIARLLALMTGAALLIEVVSAAQARATAEIFTPDSAIAHTIARSNTASTLADQSRDAANKQVSLGFACPDLAMQNAVLAAIARQHGKSAAARARTFLTPWGVHAADDPPGTSSQTKAPSSAADPERDGAAPQSDAGLLSIGVLATNKCRWLTSAVEALAMFAVRQAPSSDGSIASRQNVMIFVGADAEGRINTDGTGPAAAHIWKLARRLGVLDHLTLIPAMEARRDPVLSLDALVLTDCTGMHRSLTLDAMGSGVAVISPTDPLVDDLASGMTCRVVATPTPAAWLDAFNTILADRGKRRELATRAWEYVRRERSAYTHVVAVSQAYAAMAGVEV